MIWDSIEDLIEEDDWEKGYACNGCGCTTFHVLIRFGETRVACTECDETLFELGADKPATPI